MALHVIVGAGTIGTSTALLLAERGDRVRVLTRSGSGPRHPAIERVAADATDTEALRRHTTGAVALYNCANPPYDKWPRFWPPLAAALLHAAQATGAVLVTTGNLYGYGPVDRPMTESMPLAATSVKGRVRARMWQDALAAYEAGRVRATEARASDFIGPRSNSMFNERMLPALLAGKTVRVPIDFDQPHTVTYIHDVAKTLVTLAGDERAWGRAWHVPSAPARTYREIANRAAELAGMPTPKLAGIPMAMVRLAGLFSPLIREYVEVSYQFLRPFVLDSSAAQQTFSLAPTPLDEAIAAGLPATLARA